MAVLSELLMLKEGERVEFKEAKSHFEFDALAKYASALSNCGGGKIVLGVSDRRPRKVVGSQAFDHPEQTRQSLIEKLHIGIDFEILDADGLRVLVFEVASRPIGLPVQYKGIAWWRKGEALLPMPQDVVRMIYAEIGHDFSGDACPGAVFSDLDENAIALFREKWLKNGGSPSLKNCSSRQLLMDCEAITARGLSPMQLSFFLAQSEIIFEYRFSDASGPAG